MKAAGPADSLLATLRVRSGMTASGPLPVHLAQATLGADPLSDVVLEGAGVARRHAQLRLRGGIWTLIDFGSESGSRVDGEMVRGEALLAPGSLIGIGQVEMTFAPLDRWEDSPPERRNSERTPLLLMAPEPRKAGPLITWIVVAIGFVIAAYFLLRTR